MYLRFVVTRVDEDSKSPQGVFVTADDLLKSGDLNSEEYRQLRTLIDEFNESLPGPPDEFRASRAIFWFKSTAKKNIRRVWELVQILRGDGYYVEVHKCRRLANICFEDKFQVAAYPSDRDVMITIQ